MEKQKVTISKELAEKIEKLREIYVTDSKIVEVHMEADEWGAGYEIIDTVSLDFLIRILYVGYEVEKTPEEKIKELFDNYGPNSHGEQIYQDERVQTGIRMTLNMLGMTVEGINDGN